MKTSVDHLSSEIQEQINEIVDVIKDFINPEKIILYGSRALGHFTEDKYEKNGILYYYTSDYDIAIITNKTEIKEYEAENEILRRVKVKPDINVVMYDIAYFNEGLSSGKYFFVTIYEDGLLVYDNKEIELVKPEPLSWYKVYTNAQEDYDYWMSLAEQYFEIAKISLKDSIVKGRKPNVAAWMLYQTIEALYTVILLVFTGQKPKIHNLYKYRRSTKGLSQELDLIFPFPTNDRYEYDLFDLLKRSYIGAKYKKEFEIGIDDLSALISRIETMITVASKICLERIAQFRR